MIINVRPEIVAKWNTENASERGDQTGNLTPDKLEEMVEDFLVDYFS